MPASEADPIGVSDLVAQALAPIRDRPIRSFAKRVLAGRSILELDFDLNLPRDPFQRLFSSRIGTMAANIIGNESRTLDVIQTLSIDIMLKAVDAYWRKRSPDGGDVTQLRTLFVPAKNDLPPALLVMAPDLKASATRRITDDLSLDHLLGDWSETETVRSDEQQVRRLVLSDPEHVRDALEIAQAEVVLSRKPKMERLSVPSPCCEVRSRTERSTAGIYCRDKLGRLGVTACFHGTGGVGTAVTVAGIASTVALASEVQDIVFIPLETEAGPNVQGGVAGILADRTPSQYDAARFEGATSGQTQTSISSHDAALLRRRPSIQLKVQTPADTNKGDSGAALVDREGHVIGFAFEKSAFGEIPQITDWIWAANALAALDLEPM